MSDTPTDTTTAVEHTTRDSNIRDSHTCSSARGGRTDSVRESRGVSYALGFVIVFSVAIAGTFALFVVGVDLLSDIDRDEAVAANQENVEVIHAEVGDMAAGGDDRRVMALELVDARLRFTDSEAVTLRLETDDADLGGDIEYDTRALLYEVPPHETTFVYALGHVYRIDERGDGATISEKPPAFEVSEGGTRLVVPVLTGPTADSPTEVGVSGTGERELVALRSGGSTSFTRTGTGEAGVDTIAGAVTVEGTDHPSAWRTALETTGFESVEITAGGAAVSGQFESDRLTVERTDIAFTLGGDS